MAPAVYSSDPTRSRGRRYPEPPPVFGDAYDEDRDRIVHSSAFRRLVYKTQVFANHEGDLFRTRLTHSLEVAQCGRLLAGALGLNATLVECLALAHDLGHTPFGHAGQDALSDCLAGHGGFEHNLQTLRVVDHLERRFPSFDGLNLCFETREGLLKRCSPEDAAALEHDEPGGVATRFLPGRETQPSLEAQVANHADEIAYDVHDIDDGVRAGLLTLDDLMAVPLVAATRQQSLSAHPGLAAALPRRQLADTLRRLRLLLLDDLVQTSRAALARAQPGDPGAARHGGALIGFSAEMRESSSALKRLLFAQLYRHPTLTQTMRVAAGVVRLLFDAYLNKPGAMPPAFAARADRHRAVADYVAGMTDRMALREYRRLTGVHAFA
ncbi:MAG: deoxyguanosinetriphosphate triphosphohydrolase [Aquabacterium sp.]